MRIGIFLLIMAQTLAISSYGAPVCDVQLRAVPGTAAETFDVTGAPKFVIISGTDRADSNTLKVAQITKKALEAIGGDVKIIDLSELPKNTFTGGYGNPPKSFKKFQDPISQADAIVVLTPEYNGSIPGGLKYFIDLLKVDSFTDKPTTMIGLAAGFQGGTSATDDLAGILRHLRANVHGTTTNMPKIGTLLDPSGNSFADTREGSGMAGHLFDQLTSFKKMVDALRPPDPGLKQTLSLNTVLKKVSRSEGIHTIQYDSGLGVSGRLSKVSVVDKNGDPAYLQFQGPTQLSTGGKEIDGQGTLTHAQGFGSPVGKIQQGSGEPISLSSADDTQLELLGIRSGSPVSLEFESGVLVKGTVTGLTRGPDGKLILISFHDCTVTANGQTLFDPAWGAYDMAVGSALRDVSPGAGDPGAYFKAAPPH